MNKNIFSMTTEELRDYREELVKQYIGEWIKPYWYFDKLTDIDILINTGHTPNNTSTHSGSVKTNNSIKL